MKRDNTLFPECLSKILDDKNVGVPTCIETIIKSEFAKKWYQRRNMIILRSTWIKQISHVSTNMETIIGLFRTLLCSYLSSIEATSR